MNNDEIGNIIADEIIEIILKRNVKITNNHRPTQNFPLNDFIIITHRNGKKRILDLASNQDITNIDYYTYEDTPKTKIKTIFKEETI